MHCRCGSGYVSTYLGMLLVELHPLLICTDINPEAARATQKTALANNVSTVQIFYLYLLL